MRTQTFIYSEGFIRVVSHSPKGSFRSLGGERGGGGNPPPPHPPPNPRQPKGAKAGPTITGHSLLTTLRHKAGRCLGLDRGIAALFTQVKVFPPPSRGFPRASLVWARKPSISPPLRTTDLGRMKVGGRTRTNIGFYRTAFFRVFFLFPPTLSPLSPFFPLLYPRLFSGEGESGTGGGKRGFSGWQDHQTLDTPCFTPVFSPVRERMGRREAKGAARSGVLLPLFPPRPALPPSFSSGEGENRTEGGKGLGGGEVPRKSLGSFATFPALPSSFLR